MRPLCTHIKHTHTLWIVLYCHSLGLQGNLISVCNFNRDRCSFVRKWIAKENYTVHSVMNNKWGLTIRITKNTKGGLREGSLVLWCELTISQLRELAVPLCVFVMYLIYNTAALSERAAHPLHHIINLQKLTIITNSVQASQPSHILNNIPSLIIPTPTTTSTAHKET